MATLDDEPAVTDSYAGSAPADDAAKGSVETPVNEIIKTAQEVKDKAEAGERGVEGSRTAWIAAGVGVGIGSAALVAALLYANRDKGNGRKA